MKAHETEKTENTENIENTEREIENDISEENQERSHPQAQRYTVD